MRSASVPVFGYLSFLASNSPIANDFIALADHLISLPQAQTVTHNIGKNTHIKNKKLKISLTLGFSQKKPFLVSWKNRSKQIISTKPNSNSHIERIRNYRVGRLKRTVAMAGRCLETKLLEVEGRIESFVPIKELVKFSWGLGRVRK